MGLRRAGGTADAVTAGTAAQENDHVPGLGLFAHHVVGRRGGDHGADFHALGRVAGVVELVDLAGGKADLVAVARIAGRGGGHELALGQLAFHGLRNGYRGVGRARDAHGLVDVAAPAQGVADAAADAGGRAAEGLDFGGVVVGFVLEEEEPVLVLAVDVDLHFHGAGVDLFRFVEMLEDALALQVLGADRAHVHQAHGAVVAAEFAAHSQIPVEGGLHGFVVDFDVGEVGAEGGVAAMVRPVGVDHLDFGDRGVALFASEVLLAEGNVGEVHGELAVGKEAAQAVLVELVEAGEHFDRARGGLLGGEGVDRVERGLARFYGVDQIVLDGGHVGFGKVAFQIVDLGVAHGGALALADELDAFARAVGALVELARQGFDREDRGALGVGQVIVDVVGGGFAEDGGNAAREQVVADAFDVVAVHKAQAGEARDAQDRRELVAQLLRFHVEARFLFHVHARNHEVPPSFERALLCVPTLYKRLRDVRMGRAAGDRESARGWTRAARGARARARGRRLRGAP